MPTSVSQLKTRYEDLIAPGDSTTFLRLLNEAEAVLQESSKWHWTKSEVELPVHTDGRVYLDTVRYASLLGVLWEDDPRHLRSRETEFLSGGDGRHYVSEGHLVDRGRTTESLLVVTGALFNGGDAVAFPPMFPGTEVNGRASFVNGDYAASWNGAAWELSIAAVAVWASSDDVASPELVTTWTPEPGALGTPTLYTSKHRIYAFLKSAEAGDTVDVLVHLAHTTLVSDDDLSLCPSARALKLAMMACIYEETNDIARAAEYRSQAEEALNENEKTHRGGIRASASIQPFGAGISPVGNLM